jgi:hypothetical protein
MGLKGMRLPGIDHHSPGLVDRVGNVIDGDDGGRAVEQIRQMAFAVGMGAHRSIELIDADPTERPMADCQRRAHPSPPSAHVFVLFAQLKAGGASLTSGYRRTGETAASKKTDRQT